MRVLTRILLIFLAVLFVLGPGLYIGRDAIAPSLASWLIRSSFGIAGFGRLDFEIIDAGTGHLLLANLSAGDGTATVETLEASFNLADLRNGRLGSLTLRGATLRARLADDNELGFGPLDPLLTLGEDSEAKSTPAEFPVDRLVLEDTRVLLATPYGPIELLTTLTATRQPDGGLTASGEARVAATSRTLAGGGLADVNSRIELTQNPAGEIETRIQISQGAARFRDIELASVIGDITLSAGREAPPTARASLRLQGLRIDRSSVPLTTIEALLRGDSASATVSVAEQPDSPNGFTMALALDGMRRDRARITMTADGPAGVLEPLIADAVAPWAPGTFAGTVSLRIRAALPGPFRDGRIDAPSRGEWRDVLRDTVASGGADFSIRAKPAGGRKSPAMLAGRITMTAASGLMDIRVMDGLRFTAPAALLAGLRDHLPETVQPWLDQGLRIDLASHDGPAALLVDLRGPTLSAQVSGNLIAKLGKARRAELSGRAILRVPTSDPTPGRPSTWAATIDDARLRLTDIEAGGAQLSVADLRYSGDFAPRGLKGRFAVLGEIGFGSAGTTATLLVDGKGTVSTERRSTRAIFDSLQLRPRDASRESAGLTLARPFTLAAATGEETTITIMTEPGEPPRFDARFSMTSEPITVHRVGASTKGPVKVAVGSLRARLTGPLALDGLAAHLTLNDLKIDDPARPFLISGISGEGRFKYNAGSFLIEAVDARVSSLADRASPGRFAPLRLALAGIAETPDDSLKLMGSVAGRSGAWSLPIVGLYRQSDGSGRLDLPPVTLEFGPERLGPADVSPILAGPVETISGRLGLAAEMAWTNTGELVRQTLVISPDDLSFGGPDGGIDGVSGDIVFNRVAPLASNGVQSLGADGMMAGVLITSPWVEFSVDGPDTATLASLSGTVLGGTVTARDVNIRAGEPITVDVLVDGVDAAALARLAKVEGLSVDGTLSGSLPVTWTPESGFSVADARLSARGPGTVRYRPGEEDAALREAGEQVSLMLDALSNFNYTDLGMTIKGHPETGYQVGLSLEGANPDLYDGYPLRFNLNLSGQLDDIIKTGYRTYTVPSRVQELLFRDAAGG